MTCARAALGLALIGLLGWADCTIPIKTVQKGGRVELFCYIDFDTRNEFVVWQSSRLGILSYGTHIHQHKTRISINQPSSQEYNLMINNVFQVDEAVFSCKVGSRTIQQWQLKIETKPEILDDKSSPRLSPVPENGTLTLWCNVTGTPYPMVTWSRQMGDPSPNSRPVSLGVTGEWLTLHNVTRHASDTYTCSATNKISTVRRHIKVRVDFLPEVMMLRPEAVIYAHPLENVWLTCAVQASPLVAAYWLSPEGDPITQSTWQLNLLEEDAPSYSMRFITVMLRTTWRGRYGTFTCKVEGYDPYDIHRVYTVAANKTVEVAELMTTRSTSTTTEAGVIRYNVK